MKNVIVVLDWFESDEDVKAFLERFHLVVLKLVNVAQKKEYEVK